MGVTTWKGGFLLQYMDDLQVATESGEQCTAWTVSLLHFLGLNGHRVRENTDTEPQKTQAAQQQMMYLG